MIDFKMQTKRSTKFHQGIININLFCKGFEFGIVTSKYWGDFEEREEPLVEQIKMAIEFNVQDSKA